MAAANSEAQSLRESLGVRAAYISWIVRRFSPPIHRTWVQKSTLLLQNRGHAEVLKKTPSSAKYVTRVRPSYVSELCLLLCYVYYIPHQKTFQVLYSLQRINSQIKAGSRENTLISYLIDRRERQFRNCVYLLNFYSKFILF